MALAPHLRFPLVLSKLLRDVALMKPNNPTNLQKGNNPPVSPIANATRSDSDFLGYLFFG